MQKITSKNDFTKMEAIFCFSFSFFILIFILYIAANLFVCFALALALAIKTVGDAFQTTLCFLALLHGCRSKSTYILPL